MSRKVHEEHRGRRRRLLRPSYVVALLVVAILGLLTYQVVRTALALRDAEAAAGQLRARVEARDLDGAAEAAQAFRDSSRVARTHSDGLLWGAASLLPYLGDDAAAVRDVAAAADRLGTSLPPIVDAIQVLDTGALLTPSGIDLDVVAEVRPVVERFSTAAAAASGTVERLDPAGLLGPVSRRVGEADEQLSTLSDTAQGVAAAVEVLPGVLGADQRRTYLLVAQNNAEIRATGGLPGSASLLSADGGNVALGFQGGAGEVNGDGSPVAPLLPGERGVFGRLPVTDFRDTNLTPDFPRAASLMAAFADSARGGRVDGVVSVDPVLLAQLLRLTGPVRVGGRELDADNAVFELLSAPYLRLPIDQQDAFFRLAARNVLAAVLEGVDDQADLLRVVADGVAQRRLLFWSADPEVQRRIQSYAVAAALPVDTGRPEVGVYLNDATGAKMQYYLRSTYDLESRGCDADGRQVLRVRTRLTNDLSDPVESLTDSVTGNGSLAPRGDSRMVLRMFAPSGGRLVGLELDGERAEVRQAEVYGRQVTQRIVQVRPGQSIELVGEFVSGLDSSGDPRLQWTPGITWGPTQAVVRSRC